MFYENVHYLNIHTQAGACSKQIILDLKVSLPLTDKIGVYGKGSAIKLSGEALCLNQPTFHI